MYIQHFSIGVDWSEIGCLMEVSAMFYICTYCVFTWSGSGVQNTPYTIISAVVESTQPESESKTMTFESESKSESLASESRVRVRVLYEIWPYRLVWWISPILIILLLLYTQDLVHVRSRLILCLYFEISCEKFQHKCFLKILEINLQRNWISLKCTNNILHCHNL